MKDWFIPYIKKHRIRYGISILLGLLAVVCGAALMFTSGFLISKAALRPENILMLYVPIVGVRTFGISRSVIQYLARLTSHDTILRILSAMRSRLYNVMEPQAFFIKSRIRTGNMLGILAEDVDHLQDVYLRTIMPSVIALGLYAIGVVMLGWFDLRFALLMALYVFFLIIVIPLGSLIWGRMKNAQWKQGRNQLYQSLTDAVLGINDWLIAGRQDAFIKQYEETEAKQLELERIFINRKTGRDLLSQLIIALMVISMVYWSGVMYASDHLTVTLIAAFVLTTLSISEAFLPVADAIEKIPQYTDSFKRLESFAATKQNEPAPLDIAPEKNEGATIRIQDVSYRYRKDDSWALRHVSIDIPQGRKVAILGRSGAGKSTLLHLLCGTITPEEGQLTINDIAANEYGRHIYSFISVLNQRPHLFHTTVANNIRLGNEQATMDDIYQAAKQVQLHDYIMSLPQGYQTILEETGNNLSGGQRQRVALARILLKNAPVVVLDEPTVGLDPTTEKQLLATIFNTLKGKTILWVTHHLTGVNQMDEVLFFENGRIVMKGSHQLLMEQNERYRRLYALDVPVQMEANVRY